jgi:hypothetical protein
LGSYGSQTKPVLLCLNSSNGFRLGDVELRSGRDGTGLWSVELPGTWNFGDSLEVVGDVDGDEVNDWMVGGSNGDSRDRGWVELRRGIDGNVSMAFSRRERAAARYR